MTLWTRFVNWWERVMCRKNRAKLLELAQTPIWHPNDIRDLQAELRQIAEDM